MNKIIRIASDFSGIGSFESALNRLNIEYKNIFACDSDKFAKQSYFANHTTEYWHDNIYDRFVPKQSLDIYMTSPPCQSFSALGKRMGKSDSNGVLFYNSLDFISKNKPKVFIFENVKGLKSDNQGNTFSEWLDLLGGLSVNGQCNSLLASVNSVPYNIFHTVLNSKNFNVPQNRERVFIVDIRGDIDFNYCFPSGSNCTQCLADILEQNVVAKYYLKHRRIKSMLDNNVVQKNKGNFFKFNPKNIKDIANCVLTNTGGRPDDTYIQEVGELTGKHWQGRYRVAKAVYSSGGLSPTLTTMVGGIVPKIIKVGNINPSNKGFNGDIFHADGVSPTLTTNKGEGRKIISKQKIRKLTPLECWRLQGFSDTEFYNAEQAGLSDSQLYKQAGNSITVNVLMAILTNLMPMFER